MADETCRSGLAAQEIKYVVKLTQTATPDCFTQNLLIAKVMPFGIEFKQAVTDIDSLQPRWQARCLNVNVQIHPDINEYAGQFLYVIYQLIYSCIWLLE